MDFSGKIAIVTGGSSGIGKATVDLLLEQGAKVIVLDLKNIEINNQRAEVLGQSKLRESFDLILTRALAKLPTLAELTIPLLKIGGIVVTAKGNYPSKEIKDSRYIIRILGISKNISETIEIPPFLPKDNFIIWEKMNNSPKIYPRRDGMPKKNPIIQEQ